MKSYKIIGPAYLAMCVLTIVGGIISAAIEIPSPMLLWGIVLITLGCLQYLFFISVLGREASRGVRWIFFLSIILVFYELLCLAQSWHTSHIHELCMINLKPVNAFDDYSNFNPFLRKFSLFTILAFLPMCLYIAVPDKIFQGSALRWIKWGAVVALVWIATNVLSGAETDSAIANSVAITVVSILLSVLILSTFVVWLLIYAWRGKISLTVYDGFLSCKGRLNRSRFWKKYLLSFSILIIASITIGMICQFEPATTANSIDTFFNPSSQYKFSPYLYALTFCFIFITTPMRMRRLHDRGIAGFWVFVFDIWIWAFVLLAFCKLIGSNELMSSVENIAFIGCIVSSIGKMVEFVLLCISGNEGDNKYGKNPAITA